MAKAVPCPCTLRREHADDASVGDRDLDTRLPVLIEREGADDAAPNAIFPWSAPNAPTNAPASWTSSMIDIVSS